MAASSSPHRDALERYISSSSTSSSYRNSSFANRSVGVLSARRPLNTQLLATSPSHSLTAYADASIANVHVEQENYNRMNERDKKCLNNNQQPLSISHSYNDVLQHRRQRRLSFSEVSVATSDLLNAYINQQTSNIDRDLSGYTDDQLSVCSDNLSSLAKKTPKYDKYHRASDNADSDDDVDSVTTDMLCNGDITQLSHQFTQNMTVGHSSSSRYMKGTKDTREKLKPMYKGNFSEHVANRGDYYFRGGSSTRSKVNISQNRSLNIAPVETDIQHGNIEESLRTVLREEFAELKESLLLSKETPSANTKKSARRCLDRELYCARKEKFDITSSLQEGYLDNTYVFDEYLPRPSKSSTPVRNLTEYETTNDSNVVSEDDLVSASTHTDPGLMQCDVSSLNSQSSDKIFLECPENSDSQQLDLTTCFHLLDTIKKTLS